MHTSVDIIPTLSANQKVLRQVSKQLMEQLLNQNHNQTEIGDRSLTCLATHVTKERHVCLCVQNDADTIAHKHSDTNMRGSHKQYTLQKTNRQMNEKSDLQLQPI